MAADYVLGIVAILVIVIDVGVVHVLLYFLDIMNRGRGRGIPNEADNCQQSGWLSLLSYVTCLQGEAQIRGGLE